jgi:TP901-1 family phage major tail protein
MTAQSGRNLLLKVHNTQTDQFDTVGGLRARGIGLAQELVNVTHGESEGRWRELIGDAGLRHGKISGSGLFRDAASDARVRGLFFDGAVTIWQVVIPDFGTIEGPFLVTALDYAGRHDEAITFEMVLESAGALTFEAAA